MKIHSRFLLLLGLTTAFGLTACNGGDDDTGDDVPPNAVRIDSFTADRMSVARGATVSLSYQVTNATSVSITASPGGALLTESTMFQGTVTSAAINEPTTFTLTAQGPNGPKMATVSVSVDQNAVEISSFAATPNPAAAGAEVTLSWTTAGATQVRVLEGTTEIHMTTTNVASGSFAVTLQDQPVTYTLEASNGTAMVTRMVTVDIAELGRIRFFQVSPNLFTGPSADVTVVWNVEGDEFSLTANGAPVAEFDGTETGTITVTVTGSTLFELNATGLGFTAIRFAAVAQSGGAETEPNDDTASANPITNGITGSIDPEEDIDFFSFTVPEGGNVYAQTSDGMGGCAVDTVLTLYGPTRDSPTVTRLGDNDQGVPGTDCSEINPAFDRFATDLPAGTYYVSVESFFGADSGDYALVLIVGQGVCGNGIPELSLGEQCDDGNTTANDGCSATCQADVIDTVTGLDQDRTFSGAVDPGFQLDFYRVVMNEPGYILAETGVPVLGECEHADGFFDTFITLHDSTFEAFYANDDIDFPGGNLCSRIDPTRSSFDRARAAVEAGTYYVGVGSIARIAIPAYQVQIRTLGRGCGNAVPEEGEQCDDGNTTAGDGCTADCRLETAGTISGAGGSLVVNLTGGRPAIIEVVTANPGQSITAVPSDGQGGCPFPTILSLRDSDLEELASARVNGECAPIDPSASPRQFGAADLEPGSYLLVVGSAATTDMGPVTVNVTIANPACGNGLPERRAGEQCDDGGTAPGDGCNATCEFEGNVSLETEPNDTIAEADASGAALNTTVTLAGTISPSTDIDVFSITVPEGATLIAKTYPTQGDPASCGRDLDTILTLRDSAGMLLTDNDDVNTGNGDYCSLIDGTMDTAAAGLAAGTYYIEVESFSATLPNYFLDLRLQ